MVYKPTPKFIEKINLFGRISGSVWVSLWGVVGLIRFAIGKPVDWAFLGVLALYATHKTIVKMGDNGVQS